MGRSRKCGNWQNVMRALKFTGVKYVNKEGPDSFAPRYTLNPQGFQYMRSLIGGEITS